MRLFALDELRAPTGVAGAARAVDPDDTADLDVLPLLLVPWQTLVAAAIAYALTLPKT